MTDLSDHRGGLHLINMNYPTAKKEKGVFFAISPSSDRYNRADDHDYQPAAQQDLTDIGLLVVRNPDGTYKFDPKKSFNRAIIVQNDPFESLIKRVTNFDRIQLPDGTHLLIEPEDFVMRQGARRIACF